MVLQEGTKCCEIATKTQAIHGRGTKSWRCIRKRGSCGIPAACLPRRDLAKGLSEVYCAVTSQDDREP
ncbi:hypothetical protein E2C01_075659 [Portunus trituberculatus]|uniref:Uncharacterized protein n=1 Tax=Portunus trituberculatus TaxID=210409 RepID=A0A5B7IGP7_PORTR|nr:hypothetical protein [Portunus trituberculatus]